MTVDSYAGIRISAKFKCFSSSLPPSPPSLQSLSELDKKGSAQISDRHAVCRAAFDKVIELNEPSKAELRQIKVK